MPPNAQLLGRAQNKRKLLGKPGGPEAGNSWAQTEQWYEQRGGGRKVKFPLRKTRSPGHPEQEVKGWEKEAGMSGKEGAEAGF